MSYELKKPYTEKQYIDFIVNYNHRRGLKTRETEQYLFALLPNEIMGEKEVEGVVIPYPVINPDYVSQHAEITRKKLVNKLYEIKAEKAYGGVIINNLLVFETNQIAITNTVASLALMGNESVASWKFYTIDGKPSVHEITKMQLLYIAQFGQNMINQSFKLEGDFNAELEQATVEQLNSPLWVEEFIANAEAEMNEISNQLIIELNPPEPEGEQEESEPID